MVSIRTLVLEYMDREGAAHIRELHIEILREKPGTPEHTIRARLSEAVADADWVITGEGKFDHQSLMGKVVSGVVKAAKNAGVKVAVLAGQVRLPPTEYRKAGIEDAIGCMDDQMTLQYAIENAEKLLADAAKKFATTHLF